MSRKKKDAWIRLGEGGSKAYFEVGTWIDGYTKNGRAIIHLSIGPRRVHTNIKHDTKLYKHLLPILEAYTTPKKHKANDDQEMKKFEGIAFT